MRSPGAVTNGGVVVANWPSVPRPLIVRGVKNGRNHVELNFFFGYAWQGDGAAILRNALYYK
jgi:hypothetical protein